MSRTLEQLAHAGGEKFDPAERQEIIDFLYQEAQLADESEYDRWEALLDDDMVYWVPGNSVAPDIDATLSVIADNRSRVAKRIAQLKTGRRLSQQPASPMRRLISSFEFKRLATAEVEVQCNFALHEFRIQLTRDIAIWAGRYEYRLRRKPTGAFRIFYKRINLINVAGPLPSMAFII